MSANTLWAQLVIAGVDVRRVESDESLGVQRVHVGWGHGDAARRVAEPLVPLTVMLEIEEVSSEPPSESWDRLTLAGRRIGADPGHVDWTPLSARYSVPKAPLPSKWFRAPPPDPKAAREARRREIDAILREDARAAPAFAMARLRAVMAAMEPKRSSVPPEIRAHLRLIEAMGDKDTPCNSRSFAILLVADGRQEKLREHRLSPPPANEPWIERARGILDVCRWGADTTLARDILAELHYYEAHRGGETRPRRDPERCVPPAVAEAVEVYERSRGLA